MHEKYLQAITVGVVSGLAVYWITSRRKYGFQTAPDGSYAPLTGDVRKIRKGMGTCADCHCCGLVTPENTSVPLATDYLCCAPDYKPPVSEWNLGVSLNIRCGLDARVYADKMQSTDSFGACGPNTVPKPTKAGSTLSCHPQVPGQVCCTEVV